MSGTPGCTDEGFLRQAAAAVMTYQGLSQLRQLLSRHTGPRDCLQRTPQTASWPQRDGQSSGSPHEGPHHTAAPQQAERDV